MTIEDIIKNLRFHESDLYNEPIKEVTVKNNVLTIVWKNGFMKSYGIY